MDGLTEFEVDEEVGSDVMVVVNVSSEDTSELADDLMVMVNISSGATDTASERVMSNASAYYSWMKLNNAESSRSGTYSMQHAVLDGVLPGGGGWGGGGGGGQGLCPLRCDR